MLVRVAPERSVRERRWDGAVSAADVCDGRRGSVDAPPSLRGDARWCGRLFRDGSVWLLQGELTLQLRRECSRCGAQFWWPLQVEVSRRFSVEELADDPLVSEDGEVDLIDLLREEIWLAWRQFVLCAPDCDGGAMKEREVSSGVDPDHPFAALAALDLGAGETR